MYKVGDKVVLLVIGDEDMEYGTTSFITAEYKYGDYSTYRIKGYGVAGEDEIIPLEIWESPLFRAMKED